LQVRIGLSAGSPSLVEGDLLGLAVTLAFRVVDIARPGEVLVTSDVAGLARGLDWAFERRGSHHLKGMHEDVELFRVRSAARV
jgi:class 3 adenylate cyclase